MPDTQLQLELDGAVRPARRPRRRAVAQTSRLAFRQLVDSGRLGRRQGQVLHALYRRGPLTIEGLARELGCKDGSVCAATNGFKATGIVCVVGQKRNASGHLADALALASNVKRELDALEAEGRLEDVLLHGRTGGRGALSRASGSMGTIGARGDDAEAQGPEVLDGAAPAAEAVDHAAGAGRTGNGAPESRHARARGM